MENIKNFAPVVIPTLCRFEHFQKCITSLEKCSGAIYTDVFIGLDYPLKESHKSGYKKIKEYLDILKTNNTFKSLTVIYRTHNYGIGPQGNAEDLINKVLINYDSFIFSEDDNIFSPNFLEFINKGLYKFKEDKKVLAINGYRHFYDIKSGKSNYFLQYIDFSAWGYGMWKDRWIQIQKLTDRKFFYAKALNIFTWINLYKNGLHRLRRFGSILTSSYPIRITDNTMSIYMAITHSYVVMPSISTVRNIGWDGSGENCQNKELSNIHNTQTIDKSKHYTYIGSGDDYLKYNHLIYRKQSYGRIRFIDLCKSVWIKVVGYK